jgi:4-hydroxy-2-oxoheptanedioate aldolase
MLFIGPNDLACSLGNGSTPHMQVPAAQEAIEQIRKEAERAGKLSGIFCVSAEQAVARFKQGFQLINIGGDIVAITSWRTYCKAVQ